MRHGGFLAPRFDRKSKPKLIVKFAAIGAVPIGPENAKFVAKVRSCAKLQKACDLDKANSHAVACTCRGADADTYAEFSITHDDFDAVIGASNDLTPVPLSHAGNKVGIGWHVNNSLRNSSRNESRPRRRSKMTVHGRSCLVSCDDMTCAMSKGIPRSPFAALEGVR